MARTGCGFIPGKLFKRHLAGLTVCSLRRIHNARAVLGVHNNSIQQNEHWKREVEVKQRLRRGKLEDAAPLIEAVEAGGAQFDETGFQRFGQWRIGRRAGRPFASGLAR